MKLSVMLLVMIFIERSLVLAGAEFTTIFQDLHADLMDAGTTRQFANSLRAKDPRDPLNPQSVSIFS
jgi:hypothetical protein